MQVELLKDWAGYKKSALIKIDDKAVLKAGFEQKIFKQVKQCK